MNTTISKFLKKYYVDGVIHTHVSLINPKGKFQFNREAFENFWDIYCSMIKDDDDNNIIVGIAEKATPHLPVLCDIDIKVEDTFELEGREHIYTEDNLISVIQIYQSVLREIVEDCTDDNLLCVVLEKPIYIKSEKDIKYIKNGFHLHFPNCFLSKVEQEVHVIPRVQDVLREMNTFANLGFEDSGSLVDKSCCKVPWLLYGSRKREDMLPYKVTKVIDSSGNELELEDAFKYYNIFDHKENLINIKGRVKEYLPRILSIIPSGRTINEIKHGIISPIKEKNRKEKNLKNNVKTSVTENLKIAKKLIPLLSQFRVDDYNEWMTIGWILYNIGDSCLEAFDLWNEFSSRSDKYDENRCIYEWERMVKKDFTLGTLKYFAQNDNPELYQEFKNEQSQEYIRASLDGSHNDIAKLLFTEYGTEFVCASIVNKSWFQFKDHHWREIEDGVFLRKLISGEILDKYVKEGGNLFAKAANSDKAEEKIHQIRIAQLQKLITNLKTSTFKACVMREACDVFYNENFKSKLDMNPYLIGFKNGVYDLKYNEFRVGRPEDYISKHMPINYVNFNKTDDRVIAVYDFLEKVFPDSSVRQYFMDQTSDVFVGGNHQKVGIFWTGEGDNGKSVTQTIMEKMLGEYAIKISTTLITSKKTNIGNANPELARSGGGVRWAVLEEPDPDEEINSGIFKSLTGNDSYWARDLFEKGKSTKEISPLYKLVFICNKLSKFRGGSADKAIWNRVRVIPFEATFVRPGEPCPETHEEQLFQKKFPMDTEFSKKIPSLLEPFAWVLLEHRKNLTIRIEPEKVRMATAMYRKQNDIYRQFIEECIIQSEHYLSLTEINAQFKEWFKEGFPGNTVPIKNELKDYFSKLWGEPETGLKWHGYRIRTIQDDIDEGKAVKLTEDDFVIYEDEE